MLREPDQNEVVLCGTIVSQPERTHCVNGWDYYSFEFCVPRLSGKEDVFNVSAPSYVFLRYNVGLSSTVLINGVMRSRNQHEEGKYRLLLSVCAKEMEQAPEEGETINHIVMTGSVCKPPVYRETPLGRRVCDIMLAVRRSYGKADFMPLIAWGNNAQTARELQTGDKIACEGRFQSRNYIKKTELSEEQRTAFEISLSNIKQLEDVP